MCTQLWFSLITKLILFRHNRAVSCWTLTRPPRPLVRAWGTTPAKKRWRHSSHGLWLPRHQRNSRQHGERKQQLTATTVQATRPLSTLPGAPSLASRPRARSVVNVNKMSRRSTFEVSTTLWMAEQSTDPDPLERPACSTTSCQLCFAALPRSCRWRSDHPRRRPDWRRRSTASCCLWRLRHPAARHVANTPSGRHARSSQHLLRLWCSQSHCRPGRSYLRPQPRHRHSTATTLRRTTGYSSRSQLAEDRPFGVHTSHPR